MNLEFFPGEYSIYRLPAISHSTYSVNSEPSSHDSLPALASLVAQQQNPNSFCSLTTTPDEISLVALSKLRNQIEDVVSAPLLKTDLNVESGFFCFRVADQLAFDVIGVIASISKVLAEHAIPILSISTFDTDYFLAGQSNRARTIAALRSQGYEIRDRS